MTLPSNLLDLLGEYGSANRNCRSEADRLHHWLRAIDGIKSYVTSEAYEGWKEAAIAWEVCGSIHEQYAKGKDPFYKTRHSDFVRHADDARMRILTKNDDGSWERKHEAK